MNVEGFRHIKLPWRNWQEFVFYSYIFMYIVYVHVFQVMRDAEPIINRLVALPILVFLYFFAIIKRGNLIFDWLERGFGLFVLSSIVSILFSENSIDVIDKCRTIIQIFILFTLLHTFWKYHTSPRFLLFCLSSSGIVLGVYIMSQYGVTEYFALMANEERVGGELINVNFSSIYMAYASIMFFWYGYYDNKSWAYLPMLFTAIMCLGGGSRTAIACLAIGDISLFLLKGHSTQKVRSIFLMTLALVFIYYISDMDLFSGVIKRFEMFLYFFSSEGKVDGSTIERMIMTQKGFQYFLEHPLMGIGLGNSHFLAQEYVHHHFYLHNNYIELLVSVGVFGTLAYYMMWFYPFYKLWKPALLGDEEAAILVVLICVNLILQNGHVAYDSIPAYFQLLAAYIKIQGLRKTQGGMVHGTV